MDDIDSLLEQIEGKRKRGRPRKNPEVKRSPGRPKKIVEVKPKVQKDKHEIDKNWTGLYEILKGHDYKDESYHIRNGLLNAQQSRLFDKITAWMEKKFYD